MSAENNNVNDINKQDDSTNILETETPINVFTSWEDLDLNPDLLRGIYSYGFE